jgi:surfeit locus 1 family protein
MTTTNADNEGAGQTTPKKPAVPLSQLHRLLFSRPWLWSTLVVIVGMLFLGRLGIWQLDRLDQRRAANALLEQQFNSEYIDLNQGLPGGNPEDVVDRQAVVNGRFDYEEQIVLKEQSLSGRPGVHLVTPLVIDGNQAILVDRGWIPATDAAAGEFEQFEETAEEAIQGVLKGSQTLSRDRQTIVEENQTEWYRIDIAAIQTLSSYDLLPVYLLQSPTQENPTASLPIREEFHLDLSGGSHFGYAIQWFLFSLLLGVIYSGYVRVNGAK